MRKAVFWVHLWFGLIIGLYFAVISATGSFLVFQEDIEASRMMPERAFVAPPVAGAKLLPLSQVIARLRTEFPDATEDPLAFINPPANPDGAYLFRLTKNKQTLSTTVDPYTGEALHRYGKQDTWLSWIDDLHVNLLLQARGKVWNGYGGLLAGTLLLSGIWLWWPRTLRQLKIRATVKRGAKASRLVSDLHNVLGIYPFLLLLVVTLTGSMIVFYQPIQKVVVSLVGTAPTPPVPAIHPSPGAKRLPIEKLLSIAESTSPHAHYVFVLYPTKPNQVFYAYRRSETGILPDTRIYIDPYTGKLLQVGREITDPRSKQIMRSASGIHFGRWGGPFIKWVYFVLGFMPLGLFVTGVLMYIQRQLSKAKSRVRRAEKAVPIAS